MATRETELKCLFAFAERVLECKKEIEEGKVKICIDTVPIGESSGRKIISYGTAIQGTEIKEINLVLESLERYQGIFI
jgi:hypothetical protein